MPSKYYFSPTELFGSEIPTDWHQIDAINDLMTAILNPLRIALKKPIIVNSCYRTPEHNKAVGGVANSQHLCNDGAAADISLGTPAENKAMFEYIKKNMTFDQCINEKNYSWIHVSYCSNRKNRMEAFDA